MANIPMLSEGSEREHATPIAPEAAPPAGAFAGRVGATLEQVGQEIGQIAQNERQRVAQEQALRAESDYLGYAMEARDRFSELKGDKALAVSEEVKQGMRDKLYEIGNTLTSRHARDMYMGSTLRNWRILESQINTHAGQQRNALGVATYNNNLSDQARFLATYAGAAAAGAGPYKQEYVEAKLEAVQRNAYQRAADLGMPEDAAHEFVDKSLAVPVDALIGTLARTGHPAARAMFESDWGKHLSAGKVAGIQTAIYGKAIDKAASDILLNAPRKDYSGAGTPDPDGPIDEGAAYRMVEAAPEELKASLYPAITKLLTKAKEDFDRAVKIHTSQIFVDGTDKDPKSPDYGKFVGIDRVKSSDEIAWMIRSGSNSLDKLNEVERKKNVAGDKENNDQSLVMLRSNLVQKLTTDPEALRKMGPSDLLAETMRDEYPGFNSGGLKQAQAILEGLQKHPRIQMLETIPKHVDDVLQSPDMFPGAGDADIRRQYRDELISELSDAMRFPDFKVDDVSVSQFIHQAMEKKITEEHWYGDTTRRLVEIREAARKAQGGGRLPMRVVRNRNTGEVRVYYEGEAEKPTSLTPAATIPTTEAGLPGGVP